MLLELISHPSGETFLPRASQTKASLIAVLLHHHNAFGPVNERSRRRIFNEYLDTAQEAKSKSCMFVCKQEGKWKLSLSEDMPIGVSTEFTPEELNTTKEDLKKDAEIKAASRKRKKDLD
jgi:hypothetical protein